MVQRLDPGLRAAEAVTRCRWLAQASARGWATGRPPSWRLRQGMTGQVPRTPLAGGALVQAGEILRWWLQRVTVEEAARMNLKHAKVSWGYVLVPGEKPRTVALPPDMRRALSRYLAWRRRQGGANRRALFVGDDGRRVTAEGLAALARPALPGLPGPAPAAPPPP